LLEKYKATFERCSVQIRTGEFEQTPVERKINNTVLIFDASGSMAGQAEGEVKIAAAKAAASRYVESLEGTNVNLSIVVYGHKGSNNESDKQLSCREIEEIYTIGQVNAQVAKERINSFSPTGWTPIAGAFEKAEDILSTYADESRHNNSILLVSDGTETCDGDPVAVAKRLNESGLNVTANVIGFDVAGEDERRLQAIAQNGGGEYYSVKNAQQLEDAMNQHRSYMERFDYLMDRLDMSAEDIVLATERHFYCVQLLEEERADMVLDINVEKDVDDQCVEYVENVYDKRYTEISAQLERDFKKTLNAWDESNAFNEEND
jgi:uncharacterized protein YegL